MISTVGDRGSPRVAASLPASNAVEREPRMLKTVAKLRQGPTPESSHGRSQSASLQYPRGAGFAPSFPPGNPNFMQPPKPSDMPHGYLQTSTSPYLNFPNFQAAPNKSKASAMLVSSHHLQYTDTASNPRWMHRAAYSLSSTSLPYRSGSTVKAPVDVTIQPYYVPQNLAMTSQPVITTSDPIGNRSEAVSSSSALVSRSGASGTSSQASEPLIVSEQTDPDSQQNLTMLPAPSSDAELIEAALSLSLTPKWTSIPDVHCISPGYEIPETGSHPPASTTTSLQINPRPRQALPTVPVSASNSTETSSFRPSWTPISDTHHATVTDVEEPTLSYEPNKVKLFAKPRGWLNANISANGTPYQHLK